MRVLVECWRQFWFLQRVCRLKLAGAVYLSDLGVGNVVGILTSILRFCMHVSLGCNTVHIGSGHGMVRGTIQSTPLDAQDPRMLQSSYITALSPSGASG